MPSPRKAQGIWSLFIVWCLVIPHRVAVAQTAKPTTRTLSSYNNYVLQGAIFIAEPYVINASTLYTGNYAYPGFIQDLMDLAVPLAAKYAGLSNLTWASYVPSGVSRSLTDQPLSDVISGRADFIMGSTPVYMSISTFIDVPTPFQTGGLIVVTRAPTSTETDFWLFTKPFTFRLWLLLGAMVLIVAQVGYFFERTSPYGFLKSPKKKKQSMFGLSSWLVRAYASMLGDRTNPGRAWSTRLFWFSTWFFTLVIVAIYTASLTSILFITALNTPVSGIDDLRKNNIPFGVVEGDLSEQFFLLTTIKKYAVLVSLMRTYPSLDALFEAVRSSKLDAAVVPTRNADYTLNKAPCDLTEVGTSFPDTLLGLGMTLGSPLTYYMGLAIDTLRESGQIDDLTTAWWIDTGSCGGAVISTVGQTGSTAIDIQNATGLFLVLLITAGLALIVLGIEFWCHARRHVPETGRRWFRHWTWVQWNAFCGYDSDDDLSNLTRHRAESVAKRFRKRDGLLLSTGPAAGFSAVHQMEAEPGGALTTTHAGAGRAKAGRATAPSLPPLVSGPGEGNGDSRGLVSAGSNGAVASPV